MTKKLVIVESPAKTKSIGKYLGEDYKVVPCSISSVNTRNNYQPTPAEGDEKTRITEKIKRFSESLSDEEIKFDGEDSEKLVL